MDWPEIKRRSREWLAAQGEPKLTRLNLLLAHEAGQYLGAYLEKEQADNESGSFGDAIFILKHGGQVWREGWIQRGLWLDLEISEHEAPRINIKDKHGKSDRWYPSHIDLLASDWQQRIKEG